MKIIAGILLLANVLVFGFWQLNLAEMFTSKQEVSQASLATEVAAQNDLSTTNTANAKQNDLAQSNVGVSESTGDGSLEASSQMGQASQGHEVTTVDGQPAIPGRDQSSASKSSIAKSGMPKSSMPKLNGEKPAAVGRPAGDSPAVQKAAATCYTVGPVFERQRAQRFRRLLAGAGRTVRVRSEQVERIISYRVLLPPSETVEAARLLQSEASAKGIANVSVVSQPQNRWAVNFGEYDELVDARARWQAVSVYGYTSLLRPQKELALAEWFDVTTPAEDVPAWSGAGMLEGVDVKSVDCE